jgi:hypothetical protein
MNDHARGRLTTYYMKVQSGRVRGELYTLTYVAGHLVVQVTASRWISIAKRLTLIPAAAITRCTSRSAHHHSPKTIKRKSLATSPAVQIDSPSPH